MCNETTIIISFYFIPSLYSPRMQPSWYQAATQAFRFNKFLIEFVFRNLCMFTSQPALFDIICWYTHPISLLPSSYDVVGSKGMKLSDWILQEHFKFTFVRRRKSVVENVFPRSTRSNLFLFRNPRISPDIGKTNIRIRKEFRCKDSWCKVFFPRIRV